MTTSAIDVVEWAYQLDADDREWLEQTARLIRPLAPQRLGVYGMMYDVDAEGVHPDLVAASDPESQRFADIMPDVYASMSPWGIGVHAVPGLVVEMGTRVASDIGGVEALNWMQEMNRPFGVGDILGLRIAASGGEGCFIGLMCGEPETLSSTERRLWTRIGSHIAAGFRLRLGLETDPADLLGEGDAVMEVDGRVKAARSDEAKARGDVLREYVRRVDRLRGRRPSEPEETLNAWEALVDGRWSLVDVFDTDGRRYIVARRNEPDAPDPRALSKRQRQVAAAAACGHSNKLIAYQLGLSTSTVGTHLARAMRKLGVSSRTELVAVVRHLAAENTPGWSG